MYLLINPDMTVNYADDHPINKNLNFSGLELMEFPDQSLEQVVGDILPEEAIWDPISKTVIRNSLFSEDHLHILNRKLLTKHKIERFYPLWKQLNILREADKEEISKMGNFIDACRRWSNNLASKACELENLQP